MSNNIVATSIVASMEKVSLAVTKYIKDMMTKEQYLEEIRQAELLVEKALEIHKR